VRGGVTAHPISLWRLGECIRSGARPLRFSRSGGRREDRSSLQECVWRGRHKARFAQFSGRERRMRVNVSDWSTSEAAQLEFSNALPEFLPLGQKMVLSALFICAEGPDKPVEEPHAICPHLRA
jgi:hypothetical protein